MAGTLRAVGLGALAIASIIGFSTVSAETREQVEPEFDAFFKMTEDLRLFLMASATRGEEADLAKGTSQYKSNEVGPSLDYTLKPFLRKRLDSEDWEHERYLWMRIGYRYVGKFYDPEKAENRGSVEIDARQPVSDNFSLTGRLKWDVRDVAGVNSKRYGVRLGIERAIAADGRTIVPYFHAETLYETQYDRWNRQVYQAGIDIGINNRWRFEPYVSAQEDDRSGPRHVNTLGLILKYSH